MPSLTINGKSIFYISPLSTTTPTKTTTLLIHGLGSSSCFYKTVLPALSPKTRCIALDTPGSGLSTLGTSEQSISSIAKDVIGLLDELDVQEKVIIVGHSMGGIVASEIAAVYPGRVKGVVLLGPVNPGPNLVEVFEKRIEAVKKDGLEILANSIPTAATGHGSTPLHHAFVRSLILGTSAEGYISLCNAIAKAKKPDYGAIKVPLLILSGEDDKTASLAGSEAILNAYGTGDGKKEIVSLEGVGHWHCVEAWEEVGSQVAKFIGRV